MMGGAAAGGQRTFSPGLGHTGAGAAAPRAFGGASAAGGGEARHFGGAVTGGEARKFGGASESGERKFGGGAASGERKFGDARSDDHHFGAEGADHHFGAPAGEERRFGSAGGDHHFGGAEHASLDRGDHGFRGADGRPRFSASGRSFSYRGHEFRRYAAARYRWPHGYRYRRWDVGYRLPREYWISDYYIDDYDAYGLDAAPDGYRWIRYGPDALLINADTGEISQSVPSVFDEEGGGGDAGG